MRYAVFHLGGDLCCLPLSSVREVVVLAPCSRVPRAPRAVRGVMNVRGRVVTVVDLGVLLGRAPVPEGASGQVVLLDRGRRDLGLLVEHVDGIDEVETLDRAPGESRAAVKGRAKGLRGPMTVLDAEGIEKETAALFKAQSWPPSAASRGR